MEDVAAWEAVYKQGGHLNLVLGTLKKWHHWALGVFENPSPFYKLRHRLQIFFHQS